MGGNAMKVIGRSRRIWFAQVTALASTVVVPQLVRAQTTPLVDLPERGFRLLSGGAVFAGGAVALPGFEIVHAVFKPWVPLEVGYAAIASHLESVGRPLQALCGMELRLPRQLSVEEFQAFNGPYVERLVRWGLMVEGRVPVSRTNVAPTVDPPEVPGVHGFSYTVPADSPGGNFVMSGMTENSPSGVVAAGDTSAAGMRQKVEYVVRAVTRRLDQLGVSFNDASHVEFYGSRGLEALISDLVIPAAGRGAHRGVRWHPGRPPVQGLEIELEARNVAREISLGH